MNKTKTREALQIYPGVSFQGQDLFGMHLCSGRQDSLDVTEGLWCPFQAHCDADCKPHNTACRSHYL